MSGYRGPVNFTATPGETRVRIRGVREREVAEATVLEAEAEAEARAAVEAIRASGRGVWFGCWVMPTWSNVIAYGESRSYDMSWGMVIRERREEGKVIKSAWGCWICQRRAAQAGE